MDSDNFLLCKRSLKSVENRVQIFKVKMLQISVLREAQVEDMISCRYVGKEQGTKLSQSSVLSQYEIDQIELGGADP